MDPNVVLHELRLAIANYRNNADEDEWNEYDTHALIDRIEDLDNWLCNGGFLPSSWNQPKGTPA